MTGRTSRQHKDKHKHTHKGQQPVVVIDRGASMTRRLCCHWMERAGRGAELVMMGRIVHSQVPSRDHQASQQREAVYMSDYGLHGSVDTVEEGEKIYMTVDFHVHGATGKASRLLK